VFEKRTVLKQNLKELTDRNRELLPGSWSLVTEKALTTGLRAKDWYTLASTKPRIHR